MTDMTELAEGTAVRRWRIVLIAAGVLILALGGLVLLQDVRATAYLGILLWLALAVVVHDLVIAPVVVGGALVMRRLGRRIPLAVLGIVQGAVLVAALMTALVLPEIARQNAPLANPTVVPLDYAANLALFSTGLAVLAAVAIGVYLVATRRTNRRSPATQD